MGIYHALSWETWSLEDSSRVFSMGWCVDRGENSQTIFKKTGRKLAEGENNWRHNHQKLAEGLAQQAVVLAENEKKITL